MNVRSKLFSGMASLAAMCFAGLLNAQTPFQFIQRDDVREEVSVSQSQINRVDQLQVHCDALCQQRVREAIGSMDQDLRQQFDQLDPEQEQLALNALEQDMLETVQLEALEDQVLNDPQMDRFNQLWTQQNGLDSLTCGPSSRQLGMSGIQISQIQALRGDAAAAMQACVQDSRLSAQQQFIQIQNIQINVINQCVDVLTDEQVQQFANMCGDPFVPEPMGQDPTTDDVGTDSSTSAADTQNSGVKTSVDRVEASSTGRNEILPRSGKQ